MQLWIQPPLNIENYTVLISTKIQPRVVSTGIVSKNQKFSTFDNICGLVRILNSYEIIQMKTHFHHYAESSEKFNAVVIYIENE